MGLRGKMGLGGREGVTDGIMDAPSQTILVLGPQKCFLIFPPSREVLPGPKDVDDKVSDATASPRQRCPSRINTNDPTCPYSPSLLKAVVQLLCWACIVHRVVEAEGHRSILLFGEPLQGHQKHLSRTAKAAL